MLECYPATRAPAPSLPETRPLSDDGEARRLDAPEAFSLACREAWRAGRLAPEDGRLLESLRRELGLGEPEAEVLQGRAREAVGAGDSGKRFSRRRYLAALLRVAYRRGPASEEEEALIERLTQLLGLDPEQEEQVRLRVGRSLEAGGGAAPISGSNDPRMQEAARQALGLPAAPGGPEGAPLASTSALEIPRPRGAADPGPVAGTPGRGAPGWLRALAGLVGLGIALGAASRALRAPEVAVPEDVARAVARWKASLDQAADEVEAGDFTAARRTLAAAAGDAAGIPDPHERSMALGISRYRVALAGIAEVHRRPPPKFPSPEAAREFMDGVDRAFHDAVEHLERVPESPVQRSLLAEVAGGFAEFLEGTRRPQEAARLRETAARYARP